MHFQMWRLFYRYIIELCYSASLFRRLNSGILYHNNRKRLSHCKRKLRSSQGMKLSRSDGNNLISR
ncbi:hypothetical protein AB26_4549 [Escherichia coli 2-011-08_S1_C2]|nr:hypothetical protein AB26_4549 [Escherichia coli 2-011-08_S1_C2]